MKKVYTEMYFGRTGKQKRQFFDISNLNMSGSELDPEHDKLGSSWKCSYQNPITSLPNNVLETLRPIGSQDCGCLDIECESDGSGKGARSFISNPGSDGTSQPSDSLDLRPQAGIAIRKCSVPKENPTFNLYAPFCNHIDYQLA